MKAEYLALIVIAVGVLFFFHGRNQKSKEIENRVSDAINNSFNEQDFETFDKVEKLSLEADEVRVKTTKRIDELNNIVKENNYSSEYINILDEDEELLSLQKRAKEINEEMSFLMKKNQKK